MAGAVHSKLTNLLIDWLTREPPPFEIPPYDYNRMKYEIRPGDVLLIEGRSRVSNLVQTITRSPWSHAALYIGKFHDIEDHQLKKKLAKHMTKRENARLIIEGFLGKGTIVAKLNSYRHHHIRICRPIGLSPEDADLVIAYAIKGLGKPYNVRHLLDLARFMLPWSIMPRRWGSSLFRTPTGEPESGICSSLVAEAFGSVNFPILPLVKTEEGTIQMIQRNPHLFTPKDFDYSPYFDIIKYPLLTPEEIPFYRRLPWSSDMLHHDKGIVTRIDSSPKKKNLFGKLMEKFHKGPSSP